MEILRVARYIVGAIGVIFLIVGVAGFAVTGMDGFAATDGDLLLGVFEVNPLHNIVHLLIGVALLGALALPPSGAAAVSGTIGAVYLLLGVFGPLITGTEANILALNQADHWLHIGSGIVLLIAAFLLLRRPQTVAREDRTGRAA